MTFAGSEAAFEVLVAANTTALPTSRRTAMAPAMVFNVGRRDKSGLHVVAYADAESATR
jgi:hypothetical protein